MLFPADELPSRCWMVEVKTGLTPPPHYTGAIWKRSFISPVRPTVHTNLWRIRNFSKTLSNWRNVKTLALRFSVDGEHLKIELYESDTVKIIMI